MKRRVEACVFGMIVLSFSVGSYADIGHCFYKQLNPKDRQWYKACIGVSEKESCRSLAFDREIGEVQYGIGDCPLEGLSGVCSSGKGDMHFYGVSEDRLKRGCDMMNGVWRQDVLDEYRREKSQ